MSVMTSLSSINGQELENGVRECDGDVRLWEYRVPKNRNLPCTTSVNVLKSSVYLVINQDTSKRVKKDSFNFRQVYLEPRSEFTLPTRFRSLEYCSVQELKSREDRKSGRRKPSFIFDRWSGVPLVQKWRGTWVSLELPGSTFPLEIHNKINK